MKLTNILSLLQLLSFVACNSSGDSNGQGIQRQLEMVEVTPGTYYTVLRPVNFQSNGFIPYGAANFTVDGDQLQVAISLDDDQGVFHRQSVHFGTRCPTTNDDVNGDGFVDYNEAIAVVGKVMLPLDNDLNSQQSGAEVYPRGPSMTYKRAASVNAINQDLWRADEVGSDDITKLPSGVRMGLEKRVVLVHGTAANSTFDGLASYRGEAPHLSLPVVCGVLTKIQ
jgi:hypothetical protein